MMIINFDYALLLLGIFLCSLLFLCCFLSSGRDERGGRETPVGQNRKRMNPKHAKGKRHAATITERCGYFFLSRNAYILLLSHACFANEPRLLMESPLFCDGWSGADELKLLDVIEEQGYGNW